MPEKNALVVDDSKSARYAMRKFLEQHGYTVDTAESADDALVYLQHRHPGAIFLDHQMPGRDGVEMLRHLKQNAVTRTIPVIICSGDEDERFRARVTAAGALSVLSKPPQAHLIGAVLHELEQAAVSADAAPPEPPFPPAAPDKDWTVEAPPAAPAASLTPGSDRAPAPESAPEPAPAASPQAAPAPAPATASQAGQQADDARIDRLEREVAALRNAFAERPVVTAETLLPALHSALEPWVHERSQVAAHRALAELAEGIARELREN